MPAVHVLCVVQAVEFASRHRFVFLLLDNDDIGMHDTLHVCSSPVALLLALCPFCSLFSASLCFSFALP